VAISIAIVPFTIARYQAAGRAGPTTSQSGLNLYLGNNLQNPDPYYRPVPFARSVPLLQAREFNIEASRRAGKKLSPREASSYWTREVIRMAIEQPSAFMRKIFQKILVFFNQFEAGDHYHIGFISDFVKFFKFPFLGLWLILPFGMAGMAVNALRSRKLTALSSVFGLYGLTLIIFFTNTRYRLPLLVILIPFFVMGIGQLISCIKERQFNKVFIYSSAITIAFFIIEFLPVRGTNDMTAYYNTHAIILNSKGFEDEAIQYWEKSSQMNKPFSAFANRQLAIIYLKKRDLKKTFYYLTKIPDDSFAAAMKYAMIGDIMVTQGQTKKAVAAYERSLEIHSGQRETRRKLVNILWRIDKKRAKEEYDKLKYISSFYDRGG
ncbi:MAG: tetratricopeptide repeat protein, partial [Desulfobacterales bacterium]